MISAALVVMSLILFCEGTGSLDIFENSISLIGVADDLSRLVCFVISTGKSK